MDPQNPLKHKISRIIRTSFSSCKSRDTSDIVERPVSTRQHHQLMELFSPKPRCPVFSLCRPREERGERREVSLMCPPVSPLFDTWQGCEGEVRRDGKGRERRGSRKKKNKGAAQLDKKGRKREKSKNNTTLWPTNPINNYYDWSTTDEDVDTDDEGYETTLFSSKSLSSDSSVSSSRRSRPIKKEAEDRTTGKDGFAVVKRSNDPYTDFRTSMVEMIVEKQIFGAKELEGLLNTFLSLNSCHHHKIIVEVFTEIWETLFSDWS